MTALQRGQLAAALAVALVAASAGRAAAPPAELIDNDAWEYSTDGGETWTQDPPRLGPREEATILARNTFLWASATFDDPDPYAALELTGKLPDGWSATWKLNDTALTVPLEGMDYRTIRGIDPDLLQGGRNRLTAEIAAVNPQFTPQSGEFAASLGGVTGEELALLPAPVLGAFGEDFFSIACRTNLPVDVTVTGETFGGQWVSASSQQRMVHALTVSGLKSPWKRYTLRARLRMNSRQTGRLRSRKDEYAPALTFAAMGNPRDGLRSWRAVSRAVAESPAELAILTGGLVTDGRDVAEWERGFFAPASDLLAGTPIYPVPSADERMSPMYRAMFILPPARRENNWTQTIAGVQLIGIDSGDDFSARSDNARWLEEVLTDSDAKFIFLVSRQPTWSSGPSGETGGEAIGQMRDVVLPLLRQHQATAILSGADRAYERSELPDGVTQIVTGAAGAPPQPLPPWSEKRNPHSQVYRGVTHYCLFTVGKEKCTLSVRDLAGEEIDARTWQPRR